MLFEATLYTSEKDVHFQDDNLEVEHVSTSNHKLTIFIAARDKMQAAKELEAFCPTAHLIVVKELAGGVLLIRA